MEEPKECLLEGNFFYKKGQMEIANNWNKALYT